MRSAFVAIEPSKELPLPELGDFCRQLDELRSRGLFRWARVVSVLHPDQYPYPNAWFQSMKQQLRKRAEEEMRKMLSGRLLFHRVSVLVSGGSDAEQMVGMVSRAARRKRADLLVLLWDGRESLWSRLFGGFAQSAISRSDVPVLVVRPGGNSGPGGKLLLASVDPERMPTAREIRWLTRISRQMCLPLRFVCVQREAPGSRLVIDASIKLRRLCRCFSTRGIEAAWEMLPEEKSVEYTVNSYAALHRADLVVAFFRGKGWFERLSRGSTLYRLLALSCRPVLVLRSPP